MPLKGLAEFISRLESTKELERIKTFMDPVLEITEVTDRISKSGGKALLFENNGTSFPLLINMFGSDSRMAAALGRETIDEAAGDIGKTFTSLTEPRQGFKKKISLLPFILKLSAGFPSRSKRRGACQKVIHREPDLSILPVLKCWPHDGGRFITLPMVHTVHPVTGKTNAGMYRMQIIDSRTAAMHWQRHKTGARHFGEWKKSGRKMPVAVALGGDPVYTYAATAPLPEDIDEYILAGILRKKRVNLVRCITCDLYVPEDADIIIEGYVDPAEEPVLEGPFGDHTGFYSLPDKYPVFHVTCITHSEKAVYPATIVGIPPMEDSFLAKATEKIFLAPLRLALLTELEDLHMPSAGVAHNLVVVRIRKSYPGQGKKVISSLMGAGQMMFTKYLLVVSGDVDIRNYRALAAHVMDNTAPESDLLFMSGPLDVLDHASDIFTLGGKLGIDATIKHKEELNAAGRRPQEERPGLKVDDGFRDRISGVKPGRMNFLNDLKVLIVGVNQETGLGAVTELKRILDASVAKVNVRIVLAVDESVDSGDLYQVAWQVLANTDPARDIEFIADGIMFIDGTIKAFREGGFPRKWPNIVCSAEKTIKRIDEKWMSLGAGSFIQSPSVKNSRLSKPGNESVIIGR